MSPSTATMLLALAGSTSGGTQVAAGSGQNSSSAAVAGGGGGQSSYRRSGSGGTKDKPFLPPDEPSLSPPPERRHSIGEASAVARALSSNARNKAVNWDPPAAAERQGSPQQSSAVSHRNGQSTPADGGGGGGSAGRRASTGMTFGGAGASAAGGPRGVEREGRDSPGGEKKQAGRGMDSAGGVDRSGGAGADMEDADDFVFIEQTAVHPWRALETDYNNLKSSHQFSGSSPKNVPPPATVGGGSGTAALPQWHGNASGVAQGGNSQDSDFLQFTGVAHAVSYVVNIVAAVTSVADGLVKDALHRRHRLQSRQGDPTGGDEDSVRSGSSGGGSVSRGRGTSFDSAGPVSEQLCPALSVYLHAVGHLHDIIQRATATAKAMPRESSLQGQLDSLMEVLY